MDNVDNKEGSRTFEHCEANENGSAIAKKSVKDCDFYLGINNKPSDYEETKNYSINHVNGNDIAQSLRKETKIDASTWKPTLEASTKTGADEKATENEQFKMEQKIELGTRVKQKNAHNENLRKARTEA